MDRKLVNQVLFFKADAYLKENPERFTDEEKIKFRKGLSEWFEGKSKTIDDEIFDFLAASGLFVDFKKREDAFMSYLNKKYANLKFKKIFDVGAGRMCRLSRSLARLGCEMYAIDPKIRINNREAARWNIKSIEKKLFLCDEFAAGGCGTNIENFDLLVGLEPCDATEHIIRQCLKYDKHFEILLCAAAHDALSGRKFKGYEDWYKYLKSISSEVKIEKKDSSYYASNSQMER